MVQFVVFFSPHSPIEPASRLTRCHLLTFLEQCRNRRWGSGDAEGTPPCVGPVSKGRTRDPYFFSGVRIGAEAMGSQGKGCESGSAMFFSRFALQKGRPSPQQMMMSQCVCFVSGALLGWLKRETHETIFDSPILTRT